MNTALWGSTIKVRLAYINGADPEALAIAFSLTGMAGKQQFLGFQRRRGCKEGILFVAAFEFAGYKPCPDVWLSGIAFVA